MYMNQIISTFPLYWSTRWLERTLGLTWEVRCILISQVISSIVSTALNWLRRTSTLVIFLSVISSVNVLSRLSKCTERTNSNSFASKKPFLHVWPEQYIMTYYETYRKNEVTNHHWLHVSFNLLDIHYDPEDPCSVDVFRRREIRSRRFVFQRRLRDILRSTLRSASDK